jgi:hypothetical protein
MVYVLLACQGISHQNALPKQVLQICLQDIMQHNGVYFAA